MGNCLSSYSTEHQKVVTAEVTGFNHRNKIFTYFGTVNFFHMRRARVKPSPGYLWWLGFEYNSLFPPLISSVLNDTQCQRGEGDGDAWLGTLWVPGNELTPFGRSEPLHWLNQIVSSNYLSSAYRKTKSDVCHVGNNLACMLLIL